MCGTKRYYRVHKHKPKWITPDLIESAITITEVEVCALWTPLLSVCGSKWFLDDNLRAKMVSFGPIMKKQTYWILARFIRAFILTKDTHMHLSVETRQEIFLYSSKMDQLPGFPSPDGGYPRCAEEWMSVNPFYKSAMATDEIKSFMKRYGFQTPAMREEERKGAAKREEERVRIAKEAAMREEQRIQAQKEQAHKEMEVDPRMQLELETPDEIGGPMENAELMCVDAGPSEINLATNQELPVIVDITTEAGAGVARIDVIKVEGDDAKEPLVTDYATSSETEPTSPRTINTTEDESEGVSSDDEGDELLIDFSTSMAIDAATTFTEEEFRASQDEEAIFLQQIEEVKEVLEFSGVNHWKQETVHALVLSGPVGLSYWASTSLGKMRQEIQRATVMLKQINEGILVAKAKIIEDREQAKRDLEVWIQAHAEVHRNMDGLGLMRKDDFQKRVVANGEIVNTGGGFLGFGSKGHSVEGTAGKRRSVYVDGTKKKKKVRPVIKNPFETPGRATTATPGERLEPVN